MTGKVRITGGVHRGRLIATPGAGTHPMGERVRLAIFNSLAQRVVGTRVLDMFAGSGALGFEALSRGATSATFVDHRTTATIRHNAQLLGYDQYDFAPSGLYDLIFVDPPYDADLAKLPIDTLPAHLAPAGTLILSLPKTASPDQLFAGQLVLVSDHTYARARILRFERPSL
jgi:16S rRNA (guanine966-N2)-methyltransferase